VLIVEDHADGRASLCALLTLLGYEVDVAIDGCEGVDMALHHNYDVAIVDLGLPKLDGFQVARLIRSAQGRSIRLLAYTAYASDEAVKSASEAGFDAHMTKPANFTDLIAWLGTPGSTH
jgi:CheY-like chemotaxis protein